MKYEPSTLKQSVTATILISMRKDGEEDIFNPLFFGNNFSQSQLHFNLEIKDPMEVFRHVKSQIDVIKVSPEPWVRLALIKSLAACSIPHSFSAAALMDQFGRVTTTLSNVVGPLQEVKFMGQGQGLISRFIIHFQFVEKKMCACNRCFSYIEHGDIEHGDFSWQPSIF